MTIAPTAQAPILDFRSTSLEEFVSFWSGRYFDRNEQLYLENIGRPLTPERLLDLFFWKNGGPISTLKGVGIYYITVYDGFMISIRQEE